MNEKFTISSVLCWLLCIGETIEEWISLTVVPKVGTICVPLPVFERVRLDRSWKFAA